MPLVQTRGAASAQGFGEFAQATAANYIEDVFSTYLYTGNGSTQTITNGIDLSTKGGLTWTKSRTTVDGHGLVDTARGGTNLLQSQSPGSDAALAATTFLTTGYDLGNAQGRLNGSGTNYVSWTFRKQPKFFDVVTYTGTGSNTTVAHSLGSVPGSIIVKRTDTTADWAVYHRSLANTQYLVLNTTAAAATGATWWNSTTPTSAVFSLGTDASVNASGGTYIAYVFAHDAGGFGLTGTDNVISCGSFTTDGSGSCNVNLGYEPQWMISKSSTVAVPWEMGDRMRGWTSDNGSNTNALYANYSYAEGAADSYLKLTSTGFSSTNQLQVSATYIYIAIRRGPMKVPTLGTSVFGLSARSGTGANATVTGGQIADAVIVKNRGSAVASLFSSRSTGELGTGYLVTSSTAAEAIAGVTILQANPWDVMDGVKVGTTSTITNASANTFINYLFRRAPSFFDEVCYTGTGVASQTFSHNLGVVPELVLIKRRSAGSGQDMNWPVAVKGSGANAYFSVPGAGGALNLTGAFGLVDPWVNNFGTGLAINSSTVEPRYVTWGSPGGFESGQTYVAYLFATCAGVSKVGSYTGTGATQTIDCGFGASGSRFVLIKRTDSTGDWYVWDSARGMISGTDPSLLLNSTAAEVNANSVYAISTGFQIVSTAADINASAGTYIFLSVA